LGFLKDALAIDSHMRRNPATRLNNAGFVPSAGAEPKSNNESARDVLPESNLGRTGCSIQPTGV
jgi:hypothetical protein